jgi:beta-glucosidase
VYYAARSTGRPFAEEQKYTSKYLDAPNDPLYPFGFGLSYTRFTYSAPRLSASAMKMNGTLKVKVTVTNSGTREGTETAQLYIRDMVASVTRPMKQLRGFQQVHLKAGENRELEFTLKADDLKFYNQDMKWVAEPGQFKVMVGGNSQNVQEAAFTLR